MNTAQLIDKLSSNGISVRADHGMLKLKHPKPLSNSQLKYLKQHKTEILKHLAKVQENKPVKPEVKPAVYCLWFYKIDNQCGYTQMGLMTAYHQQAQQQLEAIYNKPITGLQRRQ